MNGTFRGTNITVAPVIPDSVTDLDSCFKDCTSLVDVPSLPSLTSQLDDLSSAFDGCSSLKRVNFNGTFDLTLADFDSAFNDCDMLESVFVKSRENQVALITYLESQQNDGKFPSGLVVSQIVKFNEKVMKVQTEEGIEIAQLYRFKSQLLTEKNGVLVYADETEKPFSVQIDNETFFAQTVPESLLAKVRQGSGTIERRLKGIDTEPVTPVPEWQWIAKSAGTLEKPFEKEYTEIYSCTSDVTDRTFAKELFPKGGVIIAYGGAGQTVTGGETNHEGGKGGDGQIIRVEIPANPKEDIVITSVSFAKTSTDGTKQSYTTGGYYVSGSGSSATCNYKRDWTEYGSDGGIGGNNCTVVYQKHGVTKTIVAYGGGGGAGTDAKWEHSTSSNCSGTSTYWSQHGTGGTSGNGVVATDRNGANATDGTQFAGNKTTTAKLVIGVYN